MDQHAMKEKVQDAKEQAQVVLDDVREMGTKAFRDAKQMLEHKDVNVGDVERALSVAGGGVLALFGLARGGLTGVGLAVLGGSLLYRGVTGHCEAYHALGVDTTDEPAARPRPGHARHA